MMEMQLIVATIAQRWQMRLTPGHAKPDLLPLVTLLPKGGVTVVPVVRPAAASVDGAAVG
jgi:cytochrome P450